MILQMSNLQKRFASLITWSVEALIYIPNLKLA